MIKTRFFLRPSKIKIYNKLINSWRWQQLRKAKFIRNPICEECVRVGIARPTEEVHHVVPVESGRDEAEMAKLAYDIDNLQSLCKECHAAKHQRKEPQTSEAAQAFANKFFKK